MAKKTIKYLENGEYHDATVKDVGVIEELKTESKDNLVEAINEIFLGGGKGFSDLQQKVDESTQAAQNAQQATDNLQQAANNLQQRLEEVANSGLSDEEAQKIINQAVEDAKRAQAEALQAYKEAQKELDDSMAQFMEEQKAINKELEQAKADIQGDIDQKNNEIEQINAVIESTKGDLTATSARLASVRNDLSNAQMDWGKVRQEITNINGKLDSKMSNTDFDEYKERIERNETEITQTKNELQSKATKQDLDVLTGTVTTQGSSITQLAGKIEQKVSKDTLANDIDDFQVKKANIFTGTREFMGWEFSDKALGRVNDDIYNHAKVAELHNGSNLSITVNGLEVGKTYSVSIFAKASANSNTSGVKVTVDNGKSYSGLMRTVYTPHDTKVTTNWQRYYVTIVASATTMKFVFDRSGMTSDITLYLNRPKLEIGETVYAWEDNAQDIYKRVEHTEAQFDVYNDQISGIVKRQTETDKKIENVSSTFTQRADGIEANAKKYTNDKVTGLTEEFSGRLKATSQELSTEYEKQTNAKIGALSDGGSNLILNSSFLVTDNNGNATLENWRDTSSKISLTKPNGLDGTWIKVNRATTGTALGARSNYFPAKQGKLVVGVDVALDGIGNISPYVLRIEYYDVSNNRVNYEDITLQKLGLSASQITKSGSNFRYARGVYKTSNDRSDVAKACIVVPETITGYNMYLTNFFAKFSDVNDGTYEVNPLDQQASLIKQRTKIEQDSEKINLLNTQTEKLGNDIKATNTSVNVLKGEVDLKASQSTVNDLTNRVAKNAADIKVFPDKIKSEVSEVSKKIDGVNDKVDNIKVGGTNLIPHSEVDTIRGDTDYWVFSTGNINNYGGRYNPTDKSLELEAHIKDTNYQFLQWQQQNNVLMNTELAHLQVGDVLTVSAEVYIQNPNMSGNITLGFRVNPRTNYNSYFSTERGIDLRNLKTGWQRVSATGTITQKYLDCMNDVQLMRILLAANGLKENNKIAFRKIKAEKGNIVTDWSPAPEDTDASIESVKTVATQTKDGFDRLAQKTGYNASTGEFSKITTQINEGIKGVSTQVSSVSNRLDNLSVGGVNLMRNTTRDYVKFTGGGWGVDYLTPNHQAVDTPVEGGETYTFSAWVKNDSSSAGRVDLEIYQYNANGENKTNGSSSEVSVWVSPGEEKRLVFTKTLLSDTTRIRLHTRNRDNNGTATYWTKMAQVEKGNIVTDWSPAPEDLQEGINIATTKATQTDTKFERMISQIQYNDSTGEIGKYEHKITELANGTQEKISAIRTDSDKKLQSATQTLTNKIGDLESTVRTNTTNLGQYRQEMTNSAKELSTKFTSVQNNLTGVSNRLDNLNVGGTNLIPHSEVDTIRGDTDYWVFSTGNINNYGGRYNPTDKSLELEAHIKDTNYQFLQWQQQNNVLMNTELAHLQVGDVLTVSAEVYIQNPNMSGNITLGFRVNPRTNYNSYFSTERGIDLRNLKTGWQRVSATGTITQKYLDCMNDVQLMRILLAANGLKENNKIAFRKIKAEKGNIATDWSPAPEDTDNKIEVLSGKITANSNEFSTVYSKITNAKNDAINAIKGDSQWQSMGKIVTNAAFLQNSDGFAQEVSKRIVGSTGQTNLYYNSEFTYSNGNNHNVDGIISTGNIAYSVNGRYVNYRGSNSVFASTRGSLNDYYWIEQEKDKYVNVNPGEIVSASVVTWVTGGSDVPKDGYALCTIAFYKDLNSDRMGYEETSVAAKDIAYPNYKTLKVENVTVPDGANYMMLQLIVRGAADWHFSQPMLVKDDHVGMYVPSTQLQLNDISSRTQFLQDDKQFLLRIQQIGGATKADVDSTNSKIGDLQGQITANANKFNTVYTKTDIDNKINPLNSRTEFLQDNSKFLLRVQEAGGATQADVNSTNTKIGDLQGQITDTANKFNTVYTKADVDNKVDGANSKIGDLSTRVKNTEVAITSGGVTINGNTRINGTLNAKGMVLDDQTGSKLEFTPNGLDISYSQNRNQYFTFSGGGLDFWKYTEAEGIEDFPYHHKPGYARLGNLTAWDGSYNDRTNYTARKHLDYPTNYNGMGFVIDVTGGSDEFSIWQEGTSYRGSSGAVGAGEYWSLFNVNATGFGAGRGRGIHHYTSSYFWSDQEKYNWQDDATLLGTIHDNGWKELEIMSYSSTMAVTSKPHNSNAWVNGFIFGSPDGGDRLFGYDGNQWIDVVNKRTTRDNDDYKNHLASMHAYEFQAHAFTQTSQLSQKTDIEPLDTKDFMSKLLSIDLYKYRYKTQSSEEKDNYGAIIDDVNEVKKYNLPQEFITTRDKGVNTNNLIAGLIATVQEQAKQIENLTFRILEVERRSING